jgi:putative endonuclease
MESAIIREKQIKSGSRKNKLKLIEMINPGWRDLYEDII